MAKLYAEVTSDKGGRVVGKGGEEYITLTVRNGNVNVFDITFRDDGAKRGTLEVHDYSNGTKRVLEYGERHVGNTCNIYGCTNYPEFGELCDRHARENRRAMI